MSILIRNSLHVSECLLVEVEDLPGMELWVRPEVINFVGGRSMRNAEIHEDRPNEWVIDVELGNHY